MFNYSQNKTFLLVLSLKTIKHGEIKKKINTLNFVICFTISIYTAIQVFYFAAFEKMQ